MKFSTIFYTLNTQAKIKLLATFLFVLLAFQSQAQSGKITVPTGHSVRVDDAIVDKNLEYIYTIEEQKIIMWNMKTHEQIYSFESDRPFGDIELNNSGTLLALSNGFDLMIYSTITGEKLYEEKQSKNAIIKGFSDDDKFLNVANYSNGIIKMFKMDLVSHATEYTYEYKFYNNQPGPCYLLKNGNLLVVGLDGYNIINITTSEIISTFEFPVKYQQTIGYIPEQNLLITTRLNYNDNFTFINVLNGTVTKKISVKLSTSKIILSEDKKTFLLDSIDFYDKYKNDNLVIFSTKTLQPVRKIPIDKDLVNKMLYFNTDKNLLVSRDDKGVNFIDVKTGKLEYKYGQNNSSISIGNITPSKKPGDKNYPPILNVATDSAIVNVDLLRMATINKKTFIHPLTNGVFSQARIAYSTTADTVAIVTMKTIQIKNLITGKLIRPQINVGGEINLMPYSKDIFFSADGNYFYYPVYELKPATGTFFYRVSLATGVSTKLKIPELQNCILSINRDLLVGRSDLEYPNGVVVWDLQMDKIKFGVSIPDLIQNNRKERQAVQVIGFAKDEKELLIRAGSNFEWYNIDTRNKTKSSPTGFSSNSTLYYTNNEGNEIISADNNGRLVAYNKEGSQLYVKKAHAGLIPFVSFSPDDKLLYTNGEDQTIKIWRAETGELLGTMYIFNEGKDYVFLGVDGRFDGTPGGMKKLYYVKNRKTISLDKVYEKYYTPNLYQRLVSGEIFPPIQFDLKNAPKVKINYAEATRNLEVDDDTPTYQNKTGFADITVEASSDDDAIDEIRLFHNGKIVTLTTRNLIVADDGGNSKTKKYQLALLPGINNLRAIALNTQRTESDPDDIVVNYSAAGNNPNINPSPVNNNVVVISNINKDATLHLIVVGINAYDNASMTLNYALADATAFKTEIEKDAKSVITNVKTYFITDKEADKNGIINAFKEVQQNAKAQDVFVFYYAGHGVIGKDKEFYLVPKDVSDLKNVQAELEQKAIPSKLLQQYAIDIQAQKQLFILDACQSAGAFEKLLSASGEQQKNIALVARSTGTHWMAASGSQQFANEFSTLGHGAYTYVLLQALKGEAAKNKMITVNGLKNFTTTALPALMKKYNGSDQVPASYGSGNDFPVEILK